MKARTLRILTWILLIIGLILLAQTLHISSSLLTSIGRKEAQSAQLLIKTTQLVSRDSDPTMSEVYSLASDIISGNNYLPVILVDNAGNICSSRNLPLPDSLLTPAYQQQYLAHLRSTGDSAIVNLGTEQQTVYFGQSKLIDQLSYIRWLQILVVLLFVLVVYLIVARARRRERDGLWKGLALETAHQLGTPITALGAWRELLESGLSDPRIVSTEMSKDIDRLKSVSERFSKIGSTPSLTNAPLLPSIRTVTEYLSTRISKQITLTLNAPNPDVACPHEPTLLKWAIENICKNAADAIDTTHTTNPTISISLLSTSHHTVIDISDNGKGMDANTRRHIFDAGYTTKKRGWGIGLTLVKRIIEQYHHGRISVLSSQPGVGTTFRILLPQH